MASNSKDPISVRSTKLNHLVLGKGGPPLPNKSFVNRDSLLDALFALYDECNTDALRKDKNVRVFLEKYKGIIMELKQLRVSISDFEVKQIIGRGHFGEVQVVKEKITGDVYAMKILSKNETLSQQNITFYEEERDIMAKANSPWITKLNYAFQDNQNLYLVMEFHPGGDLLALLDRYDNIFSEKMACFYLAELVLAIKSLHSMGYVHRDIKPDNVLIDRTGHVKLADFGSAAKLTSKKSVNSRMPVGTPDYIAPEVLMAMNGGPMSTATYGTGCDWWSLGIVAYEMLFGQTPFSDDKVLITYNNIMSFKKSLKFPEDDEVSEVAINLIKGLLTSSEERFTDEDLCKHQFFNSVDWNNIRQTVPPHVPSVSGQDDTSNFDELEHENARPQAYNLKSKREFDGRNLPFVGFTFTVSSGGFERTNSVVDTTMAGSPLRTVSNEIDSKKIKELQETIVQFVAKESQLQQEVTSLQNKLKEQSERLVNMEEELASSDKEMAELRLDAKNLSRLLDIERKNRIVSEEKAVQMVKAIKEKYKIQDRLLKEGIQEGLLLSPCSPKFLDNDQLKALKSELIKNQKEVQNLTEELARQKELCSEYKEKMNKVIKDGSLSIKELTKIQDDNIRYVETLRQELNEAIEKQIAGENELQKCREQCKSYMDKLAAVQEVNICLQEQVDILKQMISSLEPSILAKEKNPVQQKSLCQECSVLIQQLSCAQQLNDRLQEEVKLLKKDILRLESEMKNKRETHSESHLRDEVDNLRKVVSDLRKELNEKNAEIVQSQDRGAGDEARKTTLYSDEQQCDLQKKLSLESSKCSELEKTAQELRRTLEEREKVMNLKFESLQKENEQLKLKTDDLSKQLLELESKMDVTDDTLVAHSEDVVDEVKQTRSSQESVKTDKIQLMESELQSLKETLTNTRCRLRELQQQLRKKEEEFSTISIDLRIANRETKGAQETIKNLRESNRSLREKLTNLENQQNQWQNHRGELQAQINNMEKAISVKEQDLTEQQRTFETEKAILEERVKVLRDNCGVQKQLEETCAVKTGQCQELHMQLQTYQSEVKNLQDEKLRLFKDLECMKEELKQESHKREKLEMNAEVLKNTCAEMEEQITDLDALLELREEDRKNVEYERDSLKEAILKNQQKIAEIEGKLLSEKSARTRSEELLKQIEASNDSHNAEHAAKLISMKEQLDYYKSSCEEMTEKVNDLQKAISHMEASSKGTQRKIMSLEEDNINIKEEAARHMTSIASLKASNMKLSQDLEEALSKYSRACEYAEQLEGDMESQRVSHSIEVTKLQETVGQQTKLIHFLQAKAEELEKKKKRFFGRSNKDSNVSVPWTDLEKMLDKERTKCRRLQEQLEKARAEVMACNATINQMTIDPSVPASPKSRAVHSALSNSPSPDTISLTSQSSGSSEQSYQMSQRMHHNIPHRFQVSLCMRATKCAACLDSVHFGRYSAKCQECQAVCHSKCAACIPSTCGVPQEYVRHFADSVSSSDTSVCGPHVKFSASTVEASFDKNRPAGWVKIPRSGGKQGWERCYLVLENNVLYMFDKSTAPKLPMSEASDKIELCPLNGEVIVSSAVSATELMGTAKSDLPYVLKVEVKPTTTCWPERCLYIMVPSFGEKQMWVSSLEEVVQRQKDKSVDLYKNKKLGETVLRLDGSSILDINCIHEWSVEYLLLGAMEGLFVVDLISSSIKTQVKSLPAVFQVSVVEAKKVALLICGEDRQLKIISLSAFKSCIEDGNLPSEPLALRTVEDLGSCHLFAVSPDGLYLCVATADKVYLLRWNSIFDNYCIRKELSTVEPCSCIHFTKYVVIIGTDIFYQIDLKDYSTEEFLDNTDTSLAFLVYGATQLRSFPVAILQVTPDDCEQEFLLCFHELGVFVDWDGRRTREEDLKWARLPLAFAYKAPYLFVCHFNSVEIMEILPPKSNNSGFHSFMEVSNPRFLGVSSSYSGSIYIAAFKQRLVEVICMHGKETKSSSQQVDSQNDETGSEFSFTPSLMQSLEEA